MANHLPDEEPAPIPNREMVEAHKASEAERLLRTTVKYVSGQMSVERIREIVRQETYDYSRGS